MTGKGTLVITNIVMLALGVALIMFYDNPQMEFWIAIALGVLFLAPSLFSIIMLLFTNVTEDDAMYNPRYNLIPVIGGFSFGIVIIMKAGVIIGLFKYLFAILLMVGGLYYVFYLVFSRNKIKMPNWYFFMPTVITVAGLVALLLPISSGPTLFMMTGISLVAMTITSVLIAVSEYMAARAEAKEAARAAEMAAKAKTEDVEAEAVEDTPHEDVN